MYDDESPPTSPFVTAQSLANNVYYSATWDELHSCQEAAPSDCPHKEVLEHVFSTSNVITRIRSLYDMQDNNPMTRFIDEATSDQPQTDESTHFETSEDRLMQISELSRHICRVALGMRRADAEQWSNGCHQPLMFEAANATLITHEWSMPNIESTFSSEDASHWLTKAIMQVRTMEPSAAIRANVSADVKTGVLDMLMNIPLSDDMVKDDILESLTPHHGARCMEFFSAVFISWPWSERGDISLNSSIYPAYRYSRFATTALLRQLHAIGVHVPVFGVFFMDSYAFMHIDWATEKDGHMEANSALFTEDEVEYEMKQWNLRDAGDALQFAIILNNVREYTATTLVPSVEQGLRSFGERIQNGAFSPWKWDGRVMVQDEDTEPDDEEIQEYVNSLDRSANTSFECDVASGLGDGDGDEHGRTEGRAKDEKAKLSEMDKLGPLLHSRMLDMLNGELEVKRDLPSPPSTRATTPPLPIPDDADGDAPAALGDM